MIYNYPLSDHEEELVRFFGGYDKIAADIRNPASGANRTEPRRRQDIVICFSNRSGSNLVIDGLKHFGNLAEGGEYFNFDVVIDFCSIENISTLSGYYHALKEHLLGAGESPFCTKLGWGQLYFLSKIGFVDRFLSDASYILMRRRNVLEQAVSFSIAGQTGRWTSEQAGESGEVRFDPEDIVNRLTGILESTLYFERYFALTGKERYEVTYEDLERDFGGQMTALMDWLGMPVKRTPDINEVTLRRQRDAVNANFIANMRAAHSRA